MVSGSLTPLKGVLFIFHSRYFCTIGHQGVLSLRRWSSRIQTGFHGSGLTWETSWRVKTYEYRTFTFYGRRCPRRSSRLDLCNSIARSCPHMEAPTTPNVQRTRAYTRPFWAHSFSLAATGEVALAFLSWSYLDVSVRSVTLRDLCIQSRMTGHYSRRDLPFGYPRINAR